MCDFLNRFLSLFLDGWIDKLQFWSFHTNMYNTLALIDAALLIKN